MENTKVEKIEKDYTNENMSLIKLLEIPPVTLEECLKLLEKIKYNSFGFPMVFIVFDYTVTKKWSINFRNSVNFENPVTDDIDPLKACHKTFKFIREKLMNGDLKKQL